MQEHAQTHFELFQKPNYDSMRTFLSEVAPPATYPRWLDVGSIGYATTFDEYDFTTIEPDQRIVKLGRKLFRPAGLFPSHAIHCSTVEDFETDIGFNGVLFNNSFYCITTPAQALASVARLLNDDGLLVITISTFFNDAVAYRVDGRISRIEDVIPGETLWVYYNQYSLTYLLARCGFEHWMTLEISAYGMKTMQAYVFKKQPQTPVPHGLLAASKAHQTAKWQACFDGFRADTLSTLREINRENVVLVGSVQIFLDMVKYAGMNKVAGFVPTDTAVADSEVAGVQLMSWDTLQQHVAQSEPRTLTLVVCSFAQQDEIIGRLQGRIWEHARILVPTRRSGIESLEIPFRGELMLCKGMRLDQAN